MFGQEFKILVADDSLIYTKLIQQTLLSDRHPPKTGEGCGTQASNLCHPERSNCFAPRRSYGVEGPFGKLRAGSAVSLRQDERRKAFSRCRLYSENSLKRCCRSERTAGPSTALSSASRTTTSLRMTEVRWDGWRPVPTGNVLQALPIHGQCWT